MVSYWPWESFPRHLSFPYACFPQDPQHERHMAFSDQLYNHDVPISNGFHQERHQIGNQNGRFEDPDDIPPRPQPQEIDDAFRRQCGVPTERYFVAAAPDDGTPSTFVRGSYRLPEIVTAQSFYLGQFQQVMRRLDAGDKLMLDEPVLHRHVSSRTRPGEQRRSSAFAGWDSPARSGRKRRRPRNLLNEDGHIQMNVPSRRCIRIGDSNTVWVCYEQRFKNCQQTACKLIAKAWIKAVEPKKQSTHPYTGGDEAPPYWWPKPWGPTKDDKVRHKEPDHLSKRERVHLLAHILRTVLEPDGKKHPDIRKLGLNAAKLEETAAEALSSFFKDNDANIRKKPFLTEIFKVARQEERYKLGEIDGSTEVYVTAENKPETYIFENDETSSFVKEEAAVEPSGKPPTMIGGTIYLSGRTDTATLPGLCRPGDAFIRELPMRGSQLQPPMMNVMGLRHSSADNGPMQVHDQASVSTTRFKLTLDPVPSPHDVSHRLSVTSDFHSPDGTVYPQQWQAGSNGINGSPMYAYTSQKSDMEVGLFLSPGVPMNLSQPFMRAPFEKLNDRAVTHGIPLWQWEEQAGH